MRADHRPQRDRDTGNSEAEKKYNRHDQEKTARATGEADTEKRGDDRDDGHL